MKTGLTEDLLKSNFKEFNLEKSGVYANTAENRKKGRVGQKYKESDSSDEKKKRIYERAKFGDDESLGDYMKKKKAEKEAAQKKLDDEKKKRSYTEDVHDEYHKVEPESYKKLSVEERKKKRQEVLKRALKG